MTLGKKSVDGNRLCAWRVAAAGHNRPLSSGIGLLLRGVAHG